MELERLIDWAIYGMTAKLAHLREVQDKLLEGGEKMISAEIQDDIERIEEEREMLREMQELMKDQKPLEAGMKDREVEISDRIL